MSARQQPPGNWVSGGSNGSYEVQERVIANQKSYFYWVRRYANIVQPGQETQQELISQTNRVPFGAFRF